MATKMMALGIFLVNTEHLTMNKLQIIVRSAFFTVAILSVGLFGQSVDAQSGFSGTDLNNDAAVLSLVTPYKSWAEVRKPNQSLLLPAEIVNSAAMG